MEIDLGLRKAQALTVYLVVTRQRHSRDRLATLFWPLDDQRSARANLRRALHRIQVALEGALLVASKEAIELNPNCKIQTDIEEFAAVAAECRRADSYVDNDDTAWPRRLAGAVDLYKADFLAGFNLPDCSEFDEWQFFRRDALRHDLLEILKHLVHISEQMDGPEAALGYARRWLEADPLNEPALRKLMQLYVALGRRSTALRHYDEWRHTLEVEFDVAPEPATRLLWEQIRLNDSVAGAAHAVSHEAGPLLPSVSVAARRRSPTNLPLPSTPLVGREAEIGAIVQLLAGTHGCRLLTLVGPGGIGKTRLAVEAAQRMQSQFADGAVFVAITPVATKAKVAQLIAEALQLQLPIGAVDPANLLTYLHDKAMLLILDDVESSTGAIDLLPELLAAARAVVVMVTSTERLQLCEEWVYDVRGLGYPTPAGESMSPDNARPETYGAVQMFVQSACRVNAQFDANAEAMTHIIRICQLVGGMPLALELASILTRHMPVRNIADRLEHGIAWLTASLRNAPARHRSMAEVLDQTWRRLSDAERNVLEQFASLPEGSTHDVAQDIAGATPAVLASLADKSLLDCSSSGRISMPPWLRRYALEHLSARPAALAAAHARLPQRAKDDLQATRAPLADPP